MLDSTCTISVEWKERRNRTRVVELSALRMEFMNWRWKLKSILFGIPNMHLLIFIISAEQSHARADPSHSVSSIKLPDCLRFFSSALRWIQFCTWEQSELFHELMYMWWQNNRRRWEIKNAWKKRTCWVCTEAKLLKATFVSSRHAKCVECCV